MKPQNEQLDPVSEMRVIFESYEHALSVLKRERDEAVALLRECHGHMGMGAWQLAVDTFLAGETISTMQVDKPTHRSDITDKEYDQQRRESWQGNARFSRLPATKGGKS